MMVGGLMDLAGPASPEKMFVAVGENYPGVDEGWANCGRLLLRQTARSVQLQ
jgi:hypothetical protein